MTAIHETAYPRLRSDWTDKQLRTLFTPTEEELKLKFARKFTRQQITLVSILLQLKVFQCLGRFIPFRQIPQPIINYMIQHFNLSEKLMMPILRWAVAKRVRNPTYSIAWRYARTKLYCFWIGFSFRY